MKGRLIGLLYGLTLLTGCAAITGVPPWPEGAYPQSYFEAAWEEDRANQNSQSKDKYLLWVTRFYTGTALAPGWLDLTRQVLERVGPDERDHVRERLFHMGGKIGSEWAKHDDVRRLNTRNAAVWRDALIESIRQGELDAYMNRVERDVEGLMAGELSKDDIYFERYYIDEFDF